MTHKIIIFILVLFLGLLVGAKETAQNTPTEPVGPLPTDPSQMPRNQNSLNERLGTAPGSGAITNPARRPQSRGNSNPANSIPAQNCEPNDIPCQQNQQLQRGTR